MSQVTFAIRLGEKFKAPAATSLGLTLAITAIYLSFRSIPVGRFGHDVIEVYDWAWRIYCGQIPHVDFISPIGSGFLYLCYVFLSAAHFSAFGLSLMNATISVFAVFLVLALNLEMLSAAELHKDQKIIEYKFIILTILCFGYGSTAIGITASVTYALLYNRYAYIFLAVVIAELVMPVGRLSRSEQHVRAAVLAISACALAVIKFTFLMPACLFMGLSFCSQGNWRKYVEAFFIFILLIVGYSALTGVSVDQQFADSELVSKARLGSVDFNIGFISFLKAKFLHPVFVVQAGACLILMVIFAKRKDLLSVAWILVIGFCSIYAHVTNFGLNEIPLISFVTLFALRAARADYFRKAALKWFMLALSGSFFLNGAIGFVLAGVVSAHRQDVPKIDSGAIRSLYIVNADGYGNGRYTEKLAEAQSLISANIKNPQRIAALDFSNPFNALLAVTPPKRMLTGWQLENSFTYQFFPDFDRTFGDTEIILIPKEHDPESTVPMLAIYGRKIEEQFFWVAESNRWMLMQRKH